MPRYWVQESDTLDVQKSKPDKPIYDHGVASRLEAKHWDRDWLLGWRDICRSTDERTVISAAIPRAAVGDKYLLAFTENEPYFLQANLSSFVFDYAARQKFAGTSLKYYLVKQLPRYLPRRTERPRRGSAQPQDWIRQRVLELSFTAWDMEHSRVTSGMMGRRSGGTRSAGLTSEPNLTLRTFTSMALSATR